VSNTREVIRKEVNRLLSGGGITVSAATNGTTTTLVDDAVFKSSLLDNYPFTGDIIMPTAGDEDGKWKRIASFVASTGTFTVDEAWTTGPAATDTYELFHVLHPSRIEDCISHALRKMDYETMAIPSLLPDADMEASGTTSYTAGTGATLAKDTTAANVFRHSQSLSITADATGGDDGDAYAYRQFNVVEGDTFYVWAAARNSAAATSCKLSAYDATSGVAIESETSTQLDWQILAFPFVIPADCKLLQIRPQTMTNSGVSYWDQVQLLRGRQRRYAMPSWVTSKRQVRDTVYRAQGQELESGGGRMPDECAGEKWPHIYKQVEGSTVYIRPDPPFSLGGLIFVKCLRPYAALSSDTATTDADLDWVVAKTMFECYDLLDSPQTPSDERSLFSVEKDKWARRATAFDSLFMPHPPGDWGFGGERLFRVD